MNKKNKLILISSLFLLLALGIILYIKYTNTDLITKVSDIDKDVSSSISDINWSTYDSNEITLTDSIKIIEGGTYTLTGTITDGLIYINTSDNVKLILNSVSITNSNGPAIYIANSNNVEIETVKDTINTLVDGKTYTDYDEDVSGTIFSKDNLIFSGEGTLNVTSNYLDAIVSKDDLKISSGTYNITANDDGIRGKDSIEIVDANITIKAGGDGIKATNDTDTTKGYILIHNGAFNIETNNDGIQAETKLVIEDGTFKIKTTSTNDSAKGIKAGDNIVIENGTLTLDTSDDAIHSNNYVGIKNGTITIISGDDGIHADSELIIDNGTITINKGYEGLEASEITINNGNITVVSTDDGINVAGGNDSSSQNRPGQNNFNDSNDTLTINGGTIYVNSSGDGLDANGSIYINGGTITVEGPTDNGNSSLDYDKELKITGGTLLAVGSSGMAQGISNTSTQYGVLINLNTTYQKDTKVTITDSNGKEIISYTPSKSFQSVVVSTPELKENTTYKVLINNEEYTSFTTSSINTTVGSGMMNGNMMPGGNNQGRRR